MEERNYLIILYDYYGELLTDKQRMYFEDYYFNNLSLGEISENDGYSRNAIHKNIKTAEEKLYFYEEKLGLYKKKKLLEDIIKVKHYLQIFILKKKQNHKEWYFYTVF